VHENPSKEGVKRLNQILEVPLIISDFGPKAQNRLEANKVHHRAIKNIDPTFKRITEVESSENTSPIHATLKRIWDTQTEKNILTSRNVEIEVPYNLASHKHSLSDTAGADSLQKLTPYNGSSAAPNPKPEFWVHMGPEVIAAFVLMAMVVGFLMWLERCLNRRSKREYRRCEKEEERKRRKRAERKTAIRNGDYVEISLGL
jgi:hypothetical protein